METTRSSACMLWVVKTRLEWSWTTQLSLYFSSWIDSTYRYVASLKIKCNSPKKRRKKPWNGLVNTLYHKCCPHSFRLLKPRPQFSSCAASACTCPRTSWPAGVWETSRITSALTCLIKASCSTQPHGGGMKKKKKSLSPFLLPKPSEANWCTHLHPFFPLRCELMLGSPFLFLLVLPSLTWSWLSSHPSFFFLPHAPSVPPPLFSLPFLDLSLTFFPTSSSFPASHSPIFVHLNLHEHWFWVVGCSLGAALSTAPVIEGTLYVASEQEQTIHRSWWFSHGRVLYPCCHKKWLLKLVMSRRCLEQLYAVLWPRTGVERCLNTRVSKEIMRWTVSVKSYGVGIASYKQP